MFDALSLRRLNYRQGISRTGIGEYKLIRRTPNGHQYAHVELAIEPLEGGVGIQFAEQIIAGGALPERFMSHIEIGCLNATQRGLWGFPVADFRIQVLDGSYHDTDSSNAAFEEAAGVATLDALLHSEPHLLEPVLALRASLPQKYLPEIFRDLNTRRAQIETVSGPGATIAFSIPQSEAIDYLSVLASLSGGSGILSSSSPTAFSELPASLAIDLFCTTCEREMKIPLTRGVPFTEKCLICGTTFGPSENDIGVGVVNH
jgi:elongation factor G